MDKLILTKGEQKVFDCLIQKSDMVTTRDQIAQSVWGNAWMEKYSDWQIDRLIYLLRNKLPGNYKIKTLRNSGYILTTSDIEIPKIIQKPVEGTLPSQEYLEYMNNPKNKRKVLKDVFKTFKVTPLTYKTILIINSYSYDNVDAVAREFPKSRVYFSNFDSRALKIHSDRIEKLKMTGFSTVHDDIRTSIFKNSMFDLVINDFRLNFNTTDRQNKDAMKNIYRICNSKAKVLVSAVIDPRYENVRYGKDQETAPTNKNKPWKFVAEENLIRFCFTVPYYKRLFTDSGFKILKEIDTEPGKKWNPPYRRFLLAK